MNVNERAVYDVALESVGSYENYINDNGLYDSDEVFMTRDSMMEYAYIDVIDECPKEVRFLGNERIREICYMAADTYEYRNWR